MVGLLFCLGVAFAAGVCCFGVLGVCLVLVVLFCGFRFCVPVNLL